jgi:protein phosphatase PTC7
MSRCAALCTINKYIDPVKLLSAAYRSITSYGSSTAVLCTFSQAGRLTACNLGDSGFMHIKFLCGKAFVVQKSEIQQHDFNIPYQLSKIPSEDYSKTKNDSSQPIPLNIDKFKEGTFCEDSPDDSDYFQINNAAAGDLILIASDGVYDNLFDHEILSIIQSHKHLPINTSILAQEIASAAYTKSKIQSNVSIPFNERLEQCSHIICDGGKEDDITVVVALLI